MKRFVPSSKVEVDTQSKNPRKYRFEIENFDDVTCTNAAKVIEISEFCLAKKTLKIKDTRLEENIEETFFQSQKNEFLVANFVV